MIKIIINQESLKQQKCIQDPELLQQSAPPVCIRTEQTGGAETRGPGGVKEHSSPRTCKVETFLGGGGGGLLNNPTVKKRNSIQHRLCDTVKPQTQTEICR